MVDRGTVGGWCDGVAIGLAWLAVYCLVVEPATTVLDPKLHRNYDLNYFVAAGFALSFVALCLRPLNRETIDWSERFFRFELSRSTDGTVKVVDNLKVR